MEWNGRRELREYSVRVGEGWLSGMAKAKAEAIALALAIAIEVRVIGTA